MSDNYYGVYRRRLNRYGLDYQSRIQGQREREFDNYLYKTIYRVDFEFDGEWHPASLEHYKQDYTETQCYLLTKIELQLPGGTILLIESRDGKQQPYMVWWLEQIESSGYNKYVVIKMTHFLEWEQDGQKSTQWAFFHGPATSAITDSLQTATGTGLYLENNNTHTFITTYNPLIQKDTYFEVTYKETTQAYVVKGLDVNSTPGVSYVTVDPVPLRDKTPAPTQQPDDDDNEFFWLKGGN